MCSRQIYRYVHPSDDRRFGGWGWSGRTHKHLTFNGSTLCLTEAPYIWLCLCVCYLPLTLNGSTLRLTEEGPQAEKNNKQKTISKRTNHKGHTLSNHIALALTHMLTPLAEHFPIWGDFNKLTPPNLQYIPYIYIYFLNIFHMFSFVCFSISGVKSRCGHDRIKIVPLSI